MHSSFFYCVIIWAIGVPCVGGVYGYDGNYKAATNPYLALSGGNSFCSSKCDSDTLCNGYSIDISINKCYLSSCTSYTSVLSCSSCYFAYKKSITSPDLCLTTSTTTPTITTTITTTTTPTPTTTTNKDVTQIVIKGTSCTCICTEVNQTLEESIENRKRELIVNQPGLSSTIRKYISAPDHRVSSKVIGTVAIIILVVFGLLFFLGDIISVFHFTFTKILNKNFSV